MGESSDGTTAIAEQVQQWLERVVIGLNLCPFARQPVAAQRVKIAVTEARDDAEILQVLLEELQLLSQTPERDLETTLVAVPRALQEFADYNQFLDWVDQLIEDQGWSGVFQVATFHPHYCFADANPEDPENLTNRAPYPIFHLLREEALSRALANFPDAEAIPERNMESMRRLSEVQRRQLFPYLFAAGH